MRINFVLALAALALLSTTSAGAAVGGVADSYHGQLGLGTGLGMLEKWCALPNFSFAEQGGIDGWTAKDCNSCHVGAAWNPTKRSALCTYCHASPAPVAGDRPTVAKCMTCHKKDTSKRGDLFTAAADVHIAGGMVCQDCHVRVVDQRSDHQFAKGTALDTTESTMAATLSCTSACHDREPHTGGTDRAAKLNAHVDKVACETCHTGLRPAAALASRQWNVFTTEGKPVTAKRPAGWLPEHKWYDNTGPGRTGDYHLPILTYTERRGRPGAKIYPFNPVTVDWFVKKKKSAYDDVILVPEVKAADADQDGTVTVAEMRVFYPKATLVTADMNFSISHSVAPVTQAFVCNDCHGKNGWVLDWRQLGYAKDPGGGKKGGKR